jgi:outer membrane protein assembly factor BamB
MRVPFRALLLLALAPPSARADDWPQWRGPARNGVSAETEWLDRWPDEGPRVAWRAKVGLGFSSFAVAGGRAFTVGHAEDQDTLHAFDAEKGGLLWKHSHPAELNDEFYQGGSSSTPTVDGDRVYVLGRFGHVFALEAASGKVVWSANVSKDFGIRVPRWGYSGAPLVHEGLLLLNVGEGGVAFDKATGKLAWKSADKDAGYSSPILAGRQVLLSTGNAWLAVEPKTGKELWRLRWVTEYGVNAADPVIDGNRVFLSSGYGKGGGVYALGDADPEPVWTGKAMRNQTNPCVLVGGHLYGVDGNEDKQPALKCIEFATGREKWSQGGLGAAGVSAAGGRLLVLSEAGELIVAPASPEGWKPAARAKLLEGKCWTVPVLANGRAYLRSGSGEVVCVDLRRNP